MSQQQLIKMLVSEIFKLKAEVSMIKSQLKHQTEQTAERKQNQEQNRLSDGSQTQQTQRMDPIIMEKITDELFISDETTGDEN